MLSIRMARDGLGQSRHGDVHNIGSSFTEMGIRGTTYALI